MRQAQVRLRLRGVRSSPCRPFSATSPMVATTAEAAPPFLPVHSGHLQHRRETLARLREWDTSFTVSRLEETIADTIRGGDLSLGWTLYRSVGLARGTSFDPNTRLGSYLFTALLSHSLEAAVTWTIHLGEAGRALPDFCLETLLDRIGAEGAAEQMHRLEGSLEWTPGRIEQAIVRVFLRAGDLEGVLSMLALAQQQGRPVSQAVWLEIMEVVLQPSSGTDLALHLGRLIHQTTDRRFDRLQTFLDELCHRNVRLSQEAVDALEQVVTSTLAPASFLAYLEQYNNSQTGHGMTKPKKQGK